MDTFGTYFRVTTFGESHGNAVGAVIDGCPSGLTIASTRIDNELRRRREGDPAAAHLTTSRKETDKVEWMSGVLPSSDKENGDSSKKNDSDGKVNETFITLGTPLAFVIRNHNARSKDYAALQNLLRPGHGDYTWLMKHGIRDHRGGGRSSARITAAWVVAGSVAKQLLEQKGITIAAKGKYIADDNSQSDTIGGEVACQCLGVPAGWGEPYASSLKARLAQAMMCIPSAISFEMGIGKEATQMLGSEYIDRWNESQYDPSCGRLRLTTITNHCGGVQGGISNGMPIVFTVGFHPIVTLPTPIVCADTESGKLQEITIGGRHDRCQIPRAVVIVEAMAAITLADFALQNQS